MTGHTPPQEVQEAADRAVAWIEEGKAGKGFTDTGRHRAEQLAAGKSIPLEDIHAMRQYFARHEVDRDTEGFLHDQDGYPTPGRVAWDAWGGDPGRTWANREKFDDAE